MEDSPARNSSGGSSFGFFTIVYLIVGFLAIYYLYRYLYTSTTSTTLTLVPGQISANISPASLPTIPAPFEGGEYSFNTWIYISSFNTNLNTRKHIFELQGTYFSTLLVGLGAYTNTLTVRTQTQDPTSSGAGGSPPAGENPYASAWGVNSGTTGNLSAAAVDTLFTPMPAVEESPPTVCDLPEIDMQRWTMITVVLTGRTIDVYLDGKLSRSCSGTSYYRVDPTGVKPLIAARGGFDGHIGNTVVGNYAMNPSEIYRAYLSGPNGSSQSFFTWVVSLFQG